MNLKSLKILNLYKIESIKVLRNIIRLQIKCKLLNSPNRNYQKSQGKLKNYSHKNNFLTAKVVEYPKMSEGASHMMDSVQSEAVSLIRNESRNNRLAKTNNNSEFKKSRSKQSPFQASNRSKEWNTNKTLVSLGSDTESKNTLTNVSTKMFIHHLKSPFKKGDVFKSITRTEM